MLAAEPFQTARVSRLGAIGDVPRGGDGQAREDECEQGGGEDASHKAQCNIAP